MSKDYWLECVQIAAEEVGVVLTKEQEEGIASAIDGAHETYGMAHGHDCIPNPLKTELDERKRSHSREINNLEESHRQEIKRWVEDYRTLENRYRRLVEKCEREGIRL